MRSKSLSRLCGTLYLLTIAAFLVGNMLLKMPLQDTENHSNTFQLVRDNASQYRLGNFVAFLGVVAQFALMITLYQILKPVNPFLALLALGWRAGEQILLTIPIMASFLILGLSQTVPLPSGTESDYLAQILLSAPVHIEAIAFVLLGIASIFNNMLFYKSRAIPSLLALLGVVGAALYALGYALPMIGLPEAIKNLAYPMMLFELILGVYLTFWGLKKEIA